MINPNNVMLIRVKLLVRLAPTITATKTPVFS
jgi:hypothetical protein